LPKEAYEVPERDLAELSLRFGTDVLWLSFQSTVDAFQFYHWRNGEHLRTLVYGCFDKEHTWERTEGNPESWERAVFFNPEAWNAGNKNWSASGEKRRYWPDGHSRL